LTLQHTNYSYGYGFIEYTNASDAEEAINQLRGFFIICFLYFAFSF